MILRFYIIIYLFKEPEAINTSSKVVAELEKEAAAPKTGTMKMAGEKVKWIEYLLDKYGEDYEAMVLDKRNHYQETEAQLRQKIKHYLKRPAYSVPYLRKRGLIAVGDKKTDTGTADNPTVTNQEPVDKE